MQADLLLSSIETHAREALQSIIEQQHAKNGRMRKKRGGERAGGAGGDKKKKKKER